MQWPSNAYVWALMLSIMVMVYVMIMERCKVKKAKVKRKEVKIYKEIKGSSFRDYQKGSCM